jgi:hypothetical protein
MWWMNEFFTNTPGELTNKNADLSDLARNKWNSLYLGLPKDIGYIWIPNYGCLDQELGLLDHWFLNLKKNVV